MFALNTLNVVIGLIITWTICSVVAMYVQEWVASRKQWRARMLELTIGNILTDPALLSQLYNHPVIQSLHSGQDSKNKPSYIPAAQFVQALLDIISTAGTEASLLQEQLFKIQREILRKNKRKSKVIQQRLGLILAMVRRVLVDKSGGEAANSILGSVSTEMLSLGSDFPKSRPIINKALSTVSAMKDAINSQIAASKIGQTLAGDSIGRKILNGSIAMGVTHPRLKQTLDALLMVIPEIAWESEMGLEQIRINLEEWYTNSMARLTGWYKRRVHLTTLFIGLIMALLLNIDSLMLAGRLWKEPSRIDAMISEAGSYVNSQPDQIVTQTEKPGITELLQLLGNIQLPIGWLGVPEVAIPQTGNPMPEGNCLFFPVNVQDIYGFRIGGKCYPLNNVPLPSDLTGWILKGIGLLVTGLAVSQGAPFWFDILKKIINIRLTGINPAEVAKPFG